MSRGKDWRSGARVGSLPRMLRGTLVLSCALWMLAPAVALAHPVIEQARDAYNSARHEQALELLERAEDGDDLTREDLAELLTLRAMAHRARRQMDLAEVDLFRLASLDPEHELGRRVHPTLRQLFATVLERVPGPVNLDVDAQRAGDVVTVRASINDDVAALAQGFRIHARSVSGSWQTSSQAELALSVMPRDAAEYFAEALGPGGAVIASEGSAAAPLRLEPGATNESGGVGVGGGEEEGGGELGSGGADAGGNGGGGTDGGVEAWPFIVGGVILAAGVAVALVLVFTLPSNDTQLTPPAVAPLVSAPVVLLRFE